MSYQMANTCLEPGTWGHVWQESLSPGGASLLLVALPHSAGGLALIRVIGRSVTEVRRRGCQPPSPLLRILDLILTLEWLLKIKHLQPELIRRGGGKERQKRAWRFRLQVAYPPTLFSELFKKSFLPWLFVLPGILKMEG